MGANLSTVQPSKAPVAYSKPTANYNWSSFPESKAPKDVFSPSDIKPSIADSNSNYRYALPESRRPSDVALPRKPTNANRVIAFHTSSSWKSYFEASKASNKLVVIDFTATWCGPCRYMEPTLNELAAKYNDVDFVKIDVDELYNVSLEFRVQAMPTFMFIKRGKQVDKVVGAKKEELQRKVEKYRA